MSGRDFKRGSEMTLRVSRMKNVVAVAWAGMLIVLQAVDAQVVVVKGGAPKWPIALSGLVPDTTASSHKLVEILARDLEISGWFTLVPDGSAIIRCIGRVRSRGDRITVVCSVVSHRTGREYLSRRYRARVSELRQTAHRLADEIVRAVSGKPGIAATRIALVGTRNGHKELYLCDADGGNLVQLTRDRSISIAPAWGPEGRILYYTSFLMGYPDVYSIDPVRKKRIRLVRFPGLNTGAAVSPDGRRMAVILSKDGNPELYVLEMRGWRATRLTRTPAAAEASPAWSPDGTRLAFVSDRSGTPQIYVLEADSGRTVRLHLRGSENVAPDWGPDGRLAFASRFAGIYRIGVYDFDSGVISYVSGPDADYEDPSWAPDGRHIAATRTTGFRSQVFVLDTLGDSPRLLTAYPGDWYSPAWSPKLPTNE